MTKPFTVKNVHKQMYPATYNFRGDIDGAEPSGWTTNNTDGCTTTIIASFDGHKKVLQLSDVSAAGICRIERSVTQGLNTTFEFWLAKNSLGADSDVEIYLYEGATRCIALIWDDDDLDYWAGVMNSVKDNFLIINKFSHFRIVLDDTANTFSVYIDGVLEGSGLVYENNSTNGIDKIHLRTDNVDTGYIGYIDAIGVSTDANYNVGDNAFWRYYKESTDSFEGDVVGTQGISITWVDAIDTAASVEIVAEFNEHKKVARIQYTSGVGSYDYTRHNFASQATAGWFSYWIKADDATDQHNLYLHEDTTAVFVVGIGLDIFQYYDGAWQNVGLAATNGTWYHVYLQWYADNTIDIWINNIKYITAGNAWNNMISGINRIGFLEYDAVEYGYLDAPMSSLDGDEKGDNRTFDYNDSYTREDVTSDILEGFVRQDLYEYGKAILTTRSSVTLEQDRHLIEIYNDDDEILFIGNVEKVTEDINRGIYTYKLDSFLKEELDEQITQGYTDEEISDVIVNITSNVGQADGPLILVDWDTTTSQFSLDIKNKPRKEIYKLCGEMENKIIIIKPNGKVYFDADKSSGITISDASNKIAGIPYIKQISKGINYVKIYGGFDSESGIRFVSTSSDSESITANGYLRWWAMFPQISNQTDLDSRALAIRTRTGFADNPYYCDPRFKDQGRIDCGETLVFGSTAMNITSRTWYVLGWEWQLNSDIVDFHLSNGLVEDSEFSRIPHRDFEEATDDQYARIYKTDINTIQLQLIPFSGASWDSNGVLMNADLEGTLAYLTLSSKIDEDKPIYIDFQHQTSTNATYDGLLDVDRFINNGSASSVEIENTINWDFITTAFNGMITSTYTLAAADVYAGQLYKIKYYNKEIGVSNWMIGIQVRYSIKREII